MEYMFLPLKRYAEFSGRSRRMEFWMFVLFEVLLFLVLGIIGSILIGGGMMMSSNGLSAMMAAGGGLFILLMVFILVGLALFIPGLAVAVRRLHDTDRSGWWVGGYILANIVYRVGQSMAANGSSAGSALSMVGGIAVLILFIVLLVFYCLDGTKGPNKYGPDPKGGVDAQVFA